MSLSLVAVFVWLIAANLAAMIPSRDNHWRRAYVLIALGIPLLIWFGIENGMWAVALVVLAAASILRWPLRYLWRWLRAKV